MACPDSKDKDGKVTRLSWDGETLRAPPKKFGAITNGHHVKLNGLWAESIEPLFDDADSALPSLAVKLEKPVARRWQEQCGDR